MTGSGRVGRLHYFGIGVALGVAVFLSAAVSMSTNEVTGEPEVGPLVFIVGFAATVLSFSNIVRRLHDCGRSGWVALLAFVPIISIGLALYLLFAPGDPGRNRFGLPPGKEEAPFSAQGQRDRMTQIQAAAAEAYAEGRA